MKHLTPQVIADITGGRYMGDDGSRNIRVRGAVRDNREVRPGNLFVCIKGARADGHAFAGSAFESGASCCLAERELPNAAGPYVIVDSTLDSIKTVGRYHRELFNIPVIGITGSVGKTTTKELTAAALGARFNVHKTAGNLNNELGVPLTLLSLDGRHEAAVIEMGISDFGEMGRLAQMVRPELFIITKIGYSHLDKLGSLSGVLRAKTEAFAHMGHNGTAILNGDDELLREHDPGIRKVMFGRGGHNDVRALDPVDGSRAAYSSAGEALTPGLCLSIAHRMTASGYLSFPVRIPAYGVHVAELAAAAAAAGLLLGLTGDEIAKGLLSYVPVDGRAAVTDTGMITLINDCYNANPNSVKAALASLSGLTMPKVAILGDMLELGEQSDELHYQIGVFAAQRSIGRLICCGEKAKYIYEGYASVAGAEPAWHYAKKAALIADLRGLIKKGDAVLVKASNGMKFADIAKALQTLV